MRLTYILVQGGGRFRLGRRVVESACKGDLVAMPMPQIMAKIMEVISSLSHIFKGIPPGERGRRESVTCHHDN